MTPSIPNVFVIISFSTIREGWHKAASNGYVPTVSTAKPL